MLLREFYTQEQKLDEIAIAAPLLPILEKMIMMGGTALAAWLTSQALQQAEIEFPNIQTDFTQEIERTIDIPSGVTIPRNFDISADEIQSYLDGVAASNAAVDAAVDRKMGGDNRPPRDKGKILRRAGDLIEDVIDWMIRLIGFKAFKILVGLGLGLLSIYTIYKMTKWIVKFFRSDKGKEEIEKAQKESLGESQVWARSGKKVVRKYRCTGGSRKGRVVSKMSQCFAAPDIKKRVQLKKTKARLGKRLARKAKRTKRINPASRRVAALNKRRR